jgi:hypothetical protein
MFDCCKVSTGERLSHILTNVQYRQATASSREMRNWSSEEIKLVKVCFLVKKDAETFFCSIERSHGNQRRGTRQHSESPVLLWIRFEIN